jgi:hypothetical protein
MENMEMNKMKIFTAILLSVSLLVIVFHAGCINNSDDLSIKVFTATPSIIQKGDSTLLNWFVTGATTVTIEPIFGTVDFIGNTTIQLNQTTAFTLVASNATDTVKKTIEITVQNVSEYHSIIIDDLLYNDAERDQFDIINVTVKNDLITFDIGYGGGCENHTFTLISKEAFMESWPVQVDIVLSHDDKDDPCDAYLYESLIFDLTSLKIKWKNEYQSDSGTIIMHLEDYVESIRYRFGQDQFSFLNVSIETNREVYGINETIEVTINVENHKSEEITLEFPSSQVADFQCIDPLGNTVYTWSYERAFLSVITPVTIPSQSSIEIFNTSWYRMANTGEVLENGVYTLQGFLPGFYYEDETIDYSNKLGPNIYSDPLQITFV